MIPSVLVPSVLTFSSSTFVSSSNWGITFSSRSGTVRWISWMSSWTSFNCSYSSSFSLVLASSKISEKYWIKPVIINWFMVQRGQCRTYLANISLKHFWCVLAKLNSHTMCGLWLDSCQHIHSIVTPPSPGLHTHFLLQLFKYCFRYFTGHIPHFIH